MNLSDYFDLSEVLAPEDILASRIRNVLAGDEKLLAIFGADSIETVPFLNGLDFREFPRLQVAAFSSAETQGVGNIDREDPMVVYIRIRYDAATWEPLESGGKVTLSWPYGVPSLATLTRHIVSVLKAESMFDETFPNATVASLLAERPTFGPFNFSQDVSVDGRLALNHDIQMNCTVRVVNNGANAGKIVNAAANGG